MDFVAVCVDFDFGVCVWNVSSCCVWCMLFVFSVCVCVDFVFGVCVGSCVDFVFGVWILCLACVCV